MTKIIVDIFMYIFESVLFWYYSASLFPSKRSSKFNYPIIFAGNVLLFFIYQLGHTYLNAALAFAVDMLLLIFLYRISFKTALFHSSIFVVVMLAAETFTLTLNSVIFGKNFNAFENEENVYLVMAVISKLLYFVIIMIILKLFAHREKKNVSKKYFPLLFAMPAASILILVSYRYTTYQIKMTGLLNILWVASSIGILFANVIVFIIYEQSVSNTAELYRLKAMQYQAEQDKQYFEIIDKTNQDYRVLAHDMKNHLTQIRNMTDTNDIYAYIDKILPELNKFQNTGISKNKMLDLIISKYITVCEIKNIDFSVDVKTANLYYIDDFDLSAMMNNLLDNAVCAAENSENAFISLNIYSKNDKYDILLIKNKSDAKPNTEKGRLITSKKNKEFHGLGLKSVKKTAKKYNALFDWEYDDNSKTFQTELAFPKKNEKK